MQEIENLEKAVKFLKNQCMEENDTEVFQILCIQARQLNEIFKYKLRISSKFEKVFETMMINPFQKSEQKIETKTYT